MCLVPGIGLLLVPKFNPYGGNSESPIRQVFFQFHRFYRVSTNCVLLHDLAYEHLVVYLFVINEIWHNLGQAIVVLQCSTEKSTC